MSITFFVFVVRTVTCEIYGIMNTEFESLTLEDRFIYLIQAESKAASKYMYMYLSDAFESRRYVLYTGA